jgi:hypothetical protein
VVRVGEVEFEEWFSHDGVHIDDFDLRLEVSEEDRDAARTLALDYLFDPPGGDARAGTRPGPAAATLSVTELRAEQLA